MAAPSRITDLSQTAANNLPTGAESVGSALDDYLRGIQAVLRGDLAHKGADIASSGTTDLGAIQGLYHDITGTTTITSFGTVSAGVWKVVKFEGALTLTHNATSLILPGGANITTADGDIAVAISEGSGNWRVVSYFGYGANYRNPRNVSQTLTDGATIDWDMNSGAVATVTLGGNRTMAAPTNMRTGTALLHVIQDGTGSRTITWNSAFKWPAGTAPTLTTTASRRDLFSFVCDGTNLYGSYVLDVR